MSKERRKQLDHERYLRQRDERIQKQREYYASHSELCRERVNRCRQGKRI